MVGAPVPSLSGEYMKLRHRMNVCWCQWDNNKTKLAVGSGSLWWAGTTVCNQSPARLCVLMPINQERESKVSKWFSPLQSCCKIKYKSFLNVPSFASFRKFLVGGKQSLIQRIKAIVILLFTASIMWLSFHGQHFQFTNHLKNRKFGGNTCLW